MLAVAAAGASSRKSTKVGFAVGHADQHEAASAQIACLRIDDCQRESCGYGGVYGVAVLLHDFCPALDASSSMLATMA